MALTTYTALQISLAAWLDNRTDLAAVIPDFITLAEARIRRKLRLTVAEVEESLSIVAGSRYCALPSSYGVHIAVYDNNSDHREEIPYIEAQNIEYRDKSGTPKYWGIDGTQITWDCNPSSASLRYIMRYSTDIALSNASPTNWLIQKAPDVYLYGALVEAAPYLRDDARLSIFEQRFIKAIREVQNLDDRQRVSDTMRSDIALLSNNTTFDINRGY